ncbi:MAG TPA: folylpolyglutamate synthase/dihydrofolate synthase family protein [Chryseosolibacter sp.]
MILTYPDALKYLYDNLPMFQRVGIAAFKKDLTNIRKLCRTLRDPQESFKSIHIAGTNGKGSTSHMLASILQTSGYKTGLYTSPHLKEFTERIKVNGREVTEEFVADFVNRMLPLIEEYKPSFFEITVAMAFDYFRSEKVDAAVIETGLGGRLDSTNIITPVVSVITNISWDHKEILGNSLPEIASEKAGIIKRGVPVVISERQEEVQQVFMEKAEREQCEIAFASDEYATARTPGGETLDIFRNNRIALAGVRFPLKGNYQNRNVPGVMKAVEVLRRTFSITDEQTRKGLEDVVANTTLKGRWQLLGNSPTVICDTGHNLSGVTEVFGQIRASVFNRLFVVWGMVKDKDVKPILAVLPREAHYYFCQAKIPRAMDANLLQEEAAALGLKGEVIRDVNEAKRAALSRASHDDFVFIGGSTYVVAEIDEL